MAYILPDFNLRCDVYSNASPPPAAARVASLACNLAFGRRIQLTQTSSLGALMTLLVPAGSDVRSAVCASGHDWVEVPAGSGRRYAVFGVDDVGKGFANEHRAVLLQPVVLGGVFWPVPIP